MNIYVGNLPYKTDNDTLREAFEEFGEVESVDIIVDRRSGRSRGYGFVTMPNEEHGQLAVESLDGSELDGRNLRVDISRPRQPGQSDERRDHRSETSNADKPGNRTDHNQSHHRRPAHTGGEQQKSGGIIGFIKKIFG